MSVAHRSAIEALIKLGVLIDGDHLQVMAMFKDGTALEAKLSETPIEVQDAVHRLILAISQWRELK